MRRTSRVPRAYTVAKISEKYCKVENGVEDAIASRWGGCSGGEEKIEFRSPSLNAYATRCVDLAKCPRPARSEIAYEKDNFCSVRYSRAQSNRVVRGASRGTPKASLDYTICTSNLATTLRRSARTYVHTRHGFECPRVQSPYPIKAA